MWMYELRKESVPLGFAMNISAPSWSAKIGWPSRAWTSPEGWCPIGLVNRQSITCDAQAPCPVVHDIRIPLETDPAGPCSAAWR